MIQKLILAFLTMASFSLMFLSERPMLFSIPFWGLLALLSYHDIKSFRLPNVLNAAVLLSGIIYTLYIGQPFSLTLTSFLIATVILIATTYFYYKIRNQQGMGMGDIKLFAAGAVWLHPTYLPMVLCLSSMAGILGYFLKNSLSPSEEKNPRIPFGPYLAGGIWIMWLFGDTIFALIT